MSWIFLGLAVTAAPKTTCSTVSRTMHDTVKVAMAVVVSPAPYGEA